MANPQLENGYTAIANELLEALYQAPLSGNEFRIALCVFRFTYGFKRKQVCLTFPFIAETTGIHIRSVKRSASLLKEKNIINYYKHKTRKNMFSINKNYTKWAVDNLGDGVKSDTIKGVKSDTVKVSNRTPSDGVKSDTPHILHKTNVRKENFKTSRIVPEDQKLLFENPKNYEDSSEKKNTAIEKISKLINKYESCIKDEKQSWQLVEILAPHNIADEATLWGAIVQSRTKRNPPGYLVTLLTNPKWTVSDKAYEQGKLEMRNAEVF